MHSDLNKTKSFKISNEIQSELVGISDFFKEKVGITLLKNNATYIDFEKNQGEALMISIKNAFDNNNFVFLDEFAEMYKTNYYIHFIVNNYIEKSIQVFLTSDGINIYNELSFYFYLLGTFDGKEILIDIDTVDYEELNNLFESYHFKIEKCIIEDKFFLESIFGSYINLLEVLNKMCAFYTFDGNRSLLISKILDLVNKSIDNIDILFENNDVEKEYSGKLDFYRGKFLLNFSHIDYIDTNNLGITKTLKSFYDKFEQQVEGYNLVVNNLDDEVKKEFFYNIFVGNVSFSLSLMLKKLSGKNKEDVISNFNYIKILDLYFENIHKDLNIESYEYFDFQSELLSNFLDLYNNNDCNIEFESSLCKNTNLAIDNFIAGDKNYNEFQIESIHHILLFSDNIGVSKMIELADSILDVGKYDNYNFEFFKLKTLSVIISRLSNFNNPKSKELIDNFINKVINYIEENMIASQLLNSYSKIYLLISQYYSRSSIIDNLDLSKKLAVKYLGSHGQMCDLGEGAGHIYQDIQKNIGYSTDKLKGVEGIKGGFEIKQYEGVFKLEEEIFIHNKFSKFLIEAFNEEGKSFQDVINEMSNTISLKIFHGVTNVIIDGPGLNNVNNLKLSNTRGFNSKVINIFDGYNLIFYYPKNFEGIFNEIYLIREAFINNKIKTLIKVFLQKKSEEIDNLTGLYNYSKLNSILNNKKGTKLSFINFKFPLVKTFNNAYGYIEGDIVLKRIAELLLKNKNIKGNIFRLSGVQFGILLDETDNIKYILNFMSKSSININGTSVKVNPIAGIVKDEESNILEKSNMALSKLKDTGNNISYYSHDTNLSEENISNIYYLEELEKAIENDGLIPYFQPIVSSKKGNPIDKYECLLRVKDSSGKINSPYHFLNIASDIGKIKEITFIMISKVFEFASGNKSNYSINLGSEDLNKNTIKYIKELLKKYGLEGSENRFTFEILESEWGGTGDFLLIIKELKDIGFKIAMDDFGADNSNLNRYLDLVESGSIDILKLDMGIVKALVDDEGLEVDSTASLIHGIVNSAHANNIQVVAEYVENEDIAYYLRRLKVDLFQGFYFGKPNKDLSILK